MSGATNWRNFRLQPLTVTAYPDDSERVYYPDHSRGIRGFSRVIVQPNPGTPNMYRWVPNMDYFVKGPGDYRLEVPPGYALLYQPIIRVNLSDFMNYIKQGIYTRTIEWPQKEQDTEDPTKTHWNYDVVIEDEVTRDNTTYPDPMIEAPSPLTSPYVSALPTLVDLPHSWSKSKVTIKLADDAPIHEGHYKAIFTHFQVSLLDIPWPEEIEGIFDGERHEYGSIATGRSVFRPSNIATENVSDGLYHGVDITMEIIDPSIIGTSWTFIQDGTVAVAAGTGLVSLSRDDDSILCTLHWNPVDAEPMLVHINRAYVFNGYSDISGSRAVLRFGRVGQSNSVATFTPVDQRGTCSLLVPLRWFHYLTELN